MPRPLHEIARDIAVAWPARSPHAKAYLKAMHYLVGIEDNFAAGNARRIVRCFLLYSKEWQGADADRIKTELREVSDGGPLAPRANIGHGGPLAPRADVGSRSEATTVNAPVVCDLC